MVDLATNNPPPITRRYGFPPSPFREFLLSLVDIPNQWRTCEFLVSRSTVSNFKAGKSPVIDPKLYEITCRNINKIELNKCTVHARYIGEQHVTV